MEKIDDTKLGDLFEQASTEYLNDLRQDGVSKIKKMFAKVYALQREIGHDENKLKGKKDSLKKTQDILEKVKKGDWSALQDNKNNENEE